jgi:hypothetical protein
VTGEVSPAAPTAAYLLDEVIHDALGFLTTVFDWRR